MNEKCNKKTRIYCKSSTRYYKCLTFVYKPAGQMYITNMERRLLWSFVQSFLFNSSPKEIAMKFIKERILNVWHGIFEEMSVAEYILWWVMRVLFIYAVIMHTDERERTLCAVNMLALYAVSFLHLIAPKNSLLANIPYRAQHVINFMELCGSFLGNFVGLYSVIFKYDRVLHAISGPVAAVGGYFIYKAILKKEKKLDSISPLMGTVFGTCFSLAIVPIWEITEFLGDFLWGTENQGFRYAPAEDDIFYKIFGHGAITDGAQLPLWDTMMDMIDASLTTIVFAFILFGTLHIVLKRKSAKDKIQVITKAKIEKKPLSGNTAAICKN